MALNHILNVPYIDIIVHCAGIGARFLGRVIEGKVPVHGQVVIIRSEVEVVIGASQVDGEEEEGGGYAVDGEGCRRRDGSLGCF